jgi:hypothetical protein
MRLFSKLCPYAETVQGKETVHARFFVPRGIPAMEPFSCFLHEFAEKSSRESVHFLAKIQCRNGFTFKFVFKGVHFFSKIQGGNPFIPV